LSEQPESSNRIKKPFEDWSIEEFLAGDDGADSESPPPPTHRTEVDDEAIRELIRHFHPSPPHGVPKLAEPVKPAGNVKGKNKTRSETLQCTVAFFPNAKILLIHASVLKECTGN